MILPAYLILPAEPATVVRRALGLECAYLCFALLVYVCVCGGGGGGGGRWVDGRHCGCDDVPMTTLPLTTSPGG